MLDVKSPLWGLQPAETLNTTQLIEAHGELMKWCDKHRGETEEEIGSYSVDARIALQSLPDRDFMSIYSPIFLNIELELHRRDVEFVDLSASRETRKIVAKRR